MDHVGSAQTVGQAARTTVQVNISLNDLLFAPMLHGCECIFRCT